MIALRNGPSRLASTRVVGGEMVRFIDRLFLFRGGVPGNGLGTSRKSGMSGTWIGVGVQGHLFPIIDAYCRFGAEQILREPKILAGWIRTDSCPDYPLAPLEEGTLFLSYFVLSRQSTQSGS